ncbi:M48 family metallopeptidase [Amycolatopsis regifaucium]|uniref:Zn-dependent protease n=1 Tax=Amycolatopsis regifaucium TaxID=546365 RepID=A0A154MFI0_9PSEU|nr:M48 family metallopeptidase [Amycolatopsis regifaucium]KZB83251.1 Zn-dependent protease [Amycolatopsis regifaucium]OKA09096.1 Zn-dependent protease [Amycolatopsis regifaucium]SFI98404.1 Zn-dependent protease with chaperone function [Amycolatopsis regifaucium]
MKSFRGLLAAVLLAGFPLLVLAFVGGIVALEVVALQHNVFAAVKLGIITVPAAWILLKTLLKVERTTDDEVPGVLVTPEAQPALWALVRELAGEAGTRPPDEIYLDPDLNAAVTERTSWLGLRVLRRRMIIGVPLIMGLRQDQFRAVLAHELGHYSNKDTRFSALTYRGRKSIARVVNSLSRENYFERFVGWIFKQYAKLYFAVSMSVCRAQEFAADAVSARLAGTEAAVSALRELEPLAVTWQFFMNNYAAIGWDAGYLPDRFGEGYRALLTDPTRAEQMEELRRNPAEEKTSRYDTHPATRDRVATLEAGAPVPVRARGERPATDLLTGAEAMLDQALFTVFSDEARAKRRTDWHSLVAIGRRHAAAEAAAEVLGERTLDTALDLLDAGRHEELADPAEKPPAGAGPRARRELAAVSVRGRLEVVVRAALADVGVARWSLSWSGPSPFTVDGSLEDLLPSALGKATAAEADTAPLRALLTAAGVSTGYRPSVTLVRS